MIQPPFVLLSLVHTNAGTLASLSHTLLQPRGHCREKWGSKQLQSSYNNDRRTVVQWKSVPNTLPVWLQKAVERL